MREHAVPFLKLQMHGPHVTLAVRLTRLVSHTVTHMHAGKTDHEAKHVSQFIGFSFLYFETQA